MNADNERAKAVKAASADFDKAQALAEKAAPPLYRGQSLEVVRAIEKALKAAQLTGNPYRNVTSGLGVLLTLVERGKTHGAQAVLQLLLDESNRITQPVSKSDALFLLWRTVLPLPVAVKQPVLDTLVSACHAADSWKSGRTLRDTSQIVAAEDRAQARRIIDSMREGIYQRQAQRSLDEMKNVQSQGSRVTVLE